ncbi:MAG: NAD(P)H-hydrate dehydratase, partial [Acidobacteriota bacterium]
DVLALGPGLGASGPTGAAIREIVKRSPAPVVLDADGVNAFAGRSRSTLTRCRSPVVITPHPGEAARLLREETAAIQADRLASARKIASETGAVAMLKGHRTITADPQGRAFINATGNPGMASGGMGDVLTGMIAGLMAQGLEPLEGAILGAFLHGFAADLAVDEPESQPSLTASAVLDALAPAFRALERDDDEPSDT